MGMSMFFPFLFRSHLERKKYKNILFASFKSLKKGVGSGARPVSHRLGSTDPDPHQNATDPQHWLLLDPYLDPRNQPNADPCGSGFRSCRGSGFISSWSRFSLSSHSRSRFYLRTKQLWIRIQPLQHRQVEKFWVYSTWRAIKNILKFLSCEKCCGSVTFWYGSELVDPYHWVTQVRIQIRILSSDGQIYHARHNP
jgi:hypothetical protein